ncbi:hypothetical protein [Aquimarina algicola]|uniref:Uncharacterized protein n=1 Tax=Aquimarina algicola TaxID=2589995 RepID=A0A504J9F5_9FLAO|nr:hypothetical protein [Aquimarina algicola]TPN87556.1 hypothetical protein FHK87_08215 [Aquimarina algicola]
MIHNQNKITLETEYIILKETPLTNNCPECYSKDGMVLSFKQKRSKSRFLIKTDKKIVESIQCHKCESTIFPGQWTLDIERVYDYHKKTITKEPGSMKFTGLFYALLVLSILVFVSGYLFLYQPQLIGLGV